MKNNFIKRFANKQTFIVFALLGLVAISVFVTACDLSFAGSDFYNSRRRQISSVEIPLYDSSGQADAPIVSADEDVVQKLFDETEENKDKLFPASNFDNWVFYIAHLHSDNVGDYEFGNGTWIAESSQNCEVYSDGRNLGSSLKQIKNVKYYRYKNRSDRWKNFSFTDFDPFTPERDPDGKLKKREERFFFFRFTATAAMNTQLDNAMLCVDTYTKFCWFYSEPSWVKTIAGNTVPNDWVDFEDPKIPSSSPGTVEHTRAYGKFYFYDPIGYVEENGKVVLYEWAKADIRNAYFNPRQNYSETAKRDPNGAGKSPYYSSETGGSGSDGEQIFMQKLTIDPLSIKNISMGVLAENAFTNRFLDDVYLYYAIEAKSTINGEQNQQIALYEQSSLRGKDGQFIVAKGETKPVGNPKAFEVDLLNGQNGSIEFNIDLVKYDPKFLGAIDLNATLINPVRECKLSENAGISFVFDSTTKTIHSPKITGTLPSYVRLSFDANFSIRPGQTRTFVIKYTADKNDDPACTGEIELHIPIKWE
ncbi:MAG: hypothetical protein P1P59_04515 [Treponemataceae bacterium]